MSGLYFPTVITIPSMVSLYKEVSLIELTTIKSTTASRIVYKGH